MTQTFVGKPAPDFAGTALIKGTFKPVKPSSHRRITQVRCYNCNQLGHIMRYCTEPASGQSLNSQGPVG